MSVLLETDVGWIISHSKFFENIKVSRATTTENFAGVGEGKLENLQSFQYLKLNPNLFEIEEPFKDTLNVNGKRVTNLDKVTLSETTNTVKSLYQQISKEATAREIFARACATPPPVEKCGGDKTVESKDRECVTVVGPQRWPKNNHVAVETTQQFFEKIKDFKWTEFRGQNPYPDISVISTVKGGGGDDECHRFVFPPSSSFYCKDVSGMRKAFEEREEGKYDLIVMDPPWRNKFIRRKKRKQHEAGYQLIDNDEISKLPIDTLLNDDGVVAVWCTNAKSHQDALIKEIFPRWGVHYQETFYWLKVTKSGVPICPFNTENKKQPYEAIILGRRESTGPVVDNLNVDNKGVKLVLSIPSSINSHKPPLIEVLERTYPNKVFRRKCEIFARYLLPGFTSVGNEVIKLQHLDLFTEQ